MKKILLFILLILSINTLLYSNEKLSDKTLFQNTGSDKNDAETSATDNQSKILFRINITHGVFGAIGLASMIPLSVIGQIMLYHSIFGSAGSDDDDDDSDAVTSASAPVSPNSSLTVYEALRISHIVLACTSYLFLGSSLIMAYITLGIKVKKNMPINFVHFVSSIITSVFYILDLISMIITGIAFYRETSYAKNLGIVHSVLSYTLLASYTVTLITLPIGWNNRRLLKKL